MKKKVKITDTDRKRPLKIARDGSIITIENILKKKKSERYNTIEEIETEIPKLRYTQQKKLVLEKFKIDPQKKLSIGILGIGSYTYQQCIEEIEKDSEVGKILVERDMLYLVHLLKKCKHGEIKL